MKKLIIALMFVLMATMGVTTVMADEGTDVTDTTQEQETITSESESAIDGSNSTIGDIVNDENSPVNVWLSENVLPYLGIAVGAAGGTSAVLLLLWWIFKKVITVATNKIKEVYEKKKETDNNAEDFKNKIVLFSTKFDQVVEVLKLTFGKENAANKKLFEEALKEAKDLFSQENTQLNNIIKTFADKYMELAKEVSTLHKSLLDMINSNSELQKEVSKDTADTLEKMANLTKEAEDKIDKEYKTITDILTIAFTNNKELVANGYATEIKKVVQDNA